MFFVILIYDFLNYFRVKYALNYLTLFLLFDFNVKIALKKHLEFMHVDSVRTKKGSQIFNGFEVFLEIFYGNMYLRLASSV